MRDQKDKNYQNMAELKEEEDLSQPSSNNNRNNQNSNHNINNNHNLNTPPSSSQNIHNNNNINNSNTLNTEIVNNIQNDQINNLNQKLTQNSENNQNNNLKTTIKSTASLNIKTLKKLTILNSVKYCILYFFFFVLFIASIILNFFFTRNAFEQNKYITISSEKLCEKSIQKFVECSQNKNRFDKCNFENRAVENCYEQSYTMNIVCFMYISEADLCYRTNNRKDFLEKCDEKLNDIMRCGNRYKYLNLDIDIIRKLILQG